MLDWCRDAGGPRSVGAVPLVRIVVCDDHGLFRAGLGHVLGELDTAAELVEAPDGARALAAAAASPSPDLVLLDLALPDMDGMETLRRLRRARPTVPVVVISAWDDPDTVCEALEAGASGFIPKESSSSELLAGLRLVLDGGVYVPRAAVGEGDAAREAARRLRRERAARLTPRQREVLHLVGRGLTNREICGVLGLSLGTVKAHLAATFDALEVTNRTEAAVRARELGLEETA